MLDMRTIDPPKKKRTLFIAVQPLLDGVGYYLPDPTQNVNYGMDLDKKEAKVELIPDPKKPFVGLAFKLEDGKFG